MDGVWVETKIVIFVENKRGPEKDERDWVRLYNVYVIGNVAGVWFKEGKICNIVFLFYYNIYNIKFQNILVENSFSTAKPHFVHVSMRILNLCLFQIHGTKESLMNGNVVSLRDYCSFIQKNPNFQSIAKNLISGASAHFPKLQNLLWNEIEADFSFSEKFFDMCKK